MIVSSRAFIASLLMLSAASVSIVAAETNIADCSGITTSAGSTSDCCNCICGHDQCAVFQRLGEELTCLPGSVHCYDPLDTDEDDAPLKQHQEEGEWVLQDADVDTTTIVANPKAKVISPHLLQCRQTPIMPGKTEECCQCACSTSSCAVFKSFGQELVCDPLKIHCYDDDDDDKETFDDAEGEWVETIKEGEQADKFAMCLDIEIPSASQTEDCCECACGTSECAIFKTAGKDLECNAANIHCYEPDEDDDDDNGSCLDVAIPDDTSTEDCCECVCGHGFCSVFKVPGKPLTCDESKVHCFDESSYNDDSNDTKKQEANAIATSDGGKGITSPMLADCSAVDVALDDTRSCCECACGHHECAIYHSIGSELTCDKLKVHCYSQEGGDDDDASGAFLEVKESSGASQLTGMAALIAAAAAMALLSFVA